jgi:hypothetical protein
MTEGEPPGAEPQIMIDPAQMAGVWANFARVSHSPYEFTLDFVRLDFATDPPQGIVVARVSLSPLLVTQLIEALRANWEIYAERSMPPEVQRHGQKPGEGGRGEPGADDAPA